MKNKKSRRGVWRTQEEGKHDGNSTGTFRLNARKFNLKRQVEKKRWIKIRQSWLCVNQNNSANESISHCNDSQIEESLVSGSVLLMKTTKGQTDANEKLLSDTVRWKHGGRTRVKWKETIGKYHSLFVRDM